MENRIKERVLCVGWRGAMHAWEWCDSHHSGRISITSDACHALRINCVENSHIDQAIVFHLHSLPKPQREWLNREHCSCWPRSNEDSLRRSSFGEQDLHRNQSDQQDLSHRRLASPVDDEIPAEEVSHSHSVHLDACLFTQNLLQLLFLCFNSWDIRKKKQTKNLKNTFSMWK